MEFLENNFEANESTINNKQFSEAKIRFVKNAWDKMDEIKRRKFKKNVSKKLKTDQEIQDFEKLLDYLESGEIKSTEKLNFKNEQGECIIPWLIIDIVVWTLLSLTGGLCTIL